MLLRRIALALGLLAAAPAASSAQVASLAGVAFVRGEASTRDGVPLVDGTQIWLQHVPPAAGEDDCGMGHLARVEGGRFASPGHEPGRYRLVAGEMSLGCIIAWHEEAVRNEHELVLHAGQTVEVRIVVPDAE